MVTFVLPENYTALRSEIYLLRPGETMSVGAVGGVLANDAVLAPGTQIDYFTAMDAAGKFAPEWGGTGDLFNYGSLSLGPSGEFTYIANTDAAG